MNNEIKIADTCSNCIYGVFNNSCSQFSTGKRKTGLCILLEPDVVFPELPTYFGGNWKYSLIANIIREIINKGYCYVDEDGPIKLTEIPTFEQYVELFRHDEISANREELESYYNQVIDYYKWWDEHSPNFRPIHVSNVCGCHSSTGKHSNPVAKSNVNKDKKRGTK